MRLIELTGGKIYIPAEAELNGERSPVHVNEFTVESNGVISDRVVAPVGSQINFKITCSSKLTDNFAVPLSGLFGAKGRTIMFEFVDGVAERVVSFPESGEWEVTEEQINIHMPSGRLFKFVGLSISIAE